MEFKRLK